MPIEIGYPPADVPKPSSTRKQAGMAVMSGGDAKYINDQDYRYAFNCVAEMQSEKERAHMQVKALQNSNIQEPNARAKIAAWNAYIKKVEREQKKSESKLEKVTADLDKKSEKMEQAAERKKRPLVPGSMVKFKDGKHMANTFDDGVGDGMSAGHTKTGGGRRRSEKGKSTPTKVNIKMG